MKKALFLLLDDFADWEGSHLSSILNQNEKWSVKTISLKEKVISIGGFSVLVDYIIGFEPKDYDLLILVGGNSWNINDQRLFKFIEESFNKNIVIGAICGAVDYLAKNGFLNDYKHTGNSVYLWKNHEFYTSEDKFLEIQAVNDRGLVTANGTAPLEFTKEILKVINFDTLENIEETMYMKRFGFYKYCEEFGNPF